MFNNRYSYLINAGVRLAGSFLIIFMLASQTAGFFSGKASAVVILRIMCCLAYLITIILSYTDFFRRYHQVCLSCLILNTSLQYYYVWIHWNDDNSAIYFSMVFLSVLGCCFMGLKFISCVITVLLKKSLEQFL